MKPRRKSAQISFSFSVSEEFCGKFMASEVVQGNPTGEQVLWREKYQHNNPPKTVKRGSSSEDDCPPNGAVLLRGVDTQQHTRVVVDGLWEVEEGTT